MGRAAIIGNHLYFIPVGKTVDGDTLSGTYKPDNDPANNWTDFKLGCIESASFNNDIQTQELICPVEDTGSGSPGGVYQTADEFVTKQNLAVNLVMGELNPLAWQIIWMSGEITDGGTGSGTFTPLSAGAFLKGWSRLAQYDHNNTLVSSAEVWSQIRLNGNVDFNEQVAKVPLTLKVFQNTLNSGVLSSLF